MDEGVTRQAGQIAPLAVLYPAFGIPLSPVIATAHGLGDVAHILAGGIAEGTIGIIVVVAIVFWLMRPGVKAPFM
jgi:hypothetical protein